MKEKVRKKQRKYIRPLVSQAVLTEEIGKLPVNAEKQKQVISYFVEHSDPIEMRQLVAELNTSASTIKALVGKKILGEEEIEVYRDPFEHRRFERTKPLPLTKEQQTAIEPILNADREKSS